MFGWGKSKDEKWIKHKTLIEGIADVAFVLDLEGKIVGIIKQHPTRHPIGEEMIGKYLRDLLGPEEGLKGAQAMREALSYGRRESFEYSQHIEQKTFHFKAHIISIPQEYRNREERLLWWAYDITDRKTDQASLWMRNELLEGILGSRIALMSDGQVDSSAITESLKIIGQATQCDRSYILEHYQTPYYQVLSLQHEWCNKNIPSQFGNPRLEQIEYEELMPGWLHSLLTTGYKYFDVSKLPDELREVFSVAKQQWILMLPIFKENMLWGILCLEYHRPHREWEDEEIRILSSTTSSIRGFIASEEAKKALHAAKIEAEKANQAKSEFLAVISHELRTPMNAILGYSQILSQSLTDEEQREHLGFIDRSGRSLLDLINNILDFSKIESKGVELEIIAFSVEQVLLEAIEVCQIKARDKGITLEYKMQDDLPAQMLGDPYRIKQVLLNLISNAVKFTAKGGVKVYLGFKEIEENGKILLHCAVQDSGIGISPEKASRLFRPFSQADGSTTRQYGGTGLGLVIAKRLVERMHGRIWVESAIDKGSTFNFTVQLDRCAQVVETSPKPKLPQEDIADLSQSTENEDKIPLTIQKKKTDKDSSLDPEFAQRFPLRILMVEDDPMNQKLATKILSRLGYHNVDVAPDGLSGLSRLKDNAYNLVLTDLQMPRLDGIGMARRIRMGECGATKKHLPIIAVTAYAMNEDRERCLDAGMNGFIRKPIQIDELKETLIMGYHQSLKRRM